ncbi:MULTISPECIES: ABC transporter permease [unclassified Virgibacillus]|uniref:ABC transporter permease n=1 Tax=unclassified Virgibacillus TaxID=2620237 RepID=UPI0024DE89CE|nr:ABC transporter permease [Virgibacillus sp. LDC-1]
MQWVHLLNANVQKEYLEMKRYLPNTIALIVTFYAIFLGMFAGIQIIGDPASQDVNTQYAIVNYIFWFLSIMIMQNIGWEITNEAMRGTLEQLCMSPMGLWRILSARLFSSTFLYLIIIVVLLVGTMLTTGQWLNIDVVTILPIMLLTLVSMIGVGFMIAGISIIWKQVQAFLQILQFILAGLTFIPLSVAPLMVFLPFVKGVDLVRNVMIKGWSFQEISGVDFLILGFNAIFYFILGLGVFLFCERIAMRKGLLAHY